MPIQIVRNDITKMECDAIVNAANPSLLGGGGVDGAIHRAAGRGLLEECSKLGGCETGQAKITGAYDLPCRYVIHTVGPVWQGGQSDEEKNLISCYRRSLELAEEYHCESVAFPLISAGAYGYPREQALQVAVSEISRFLTDHDMLVYIVVFDKGSFQISRKLIQDIAEYIDECYVEAHSMERGRSLSACPQEDAGGLFERNAFWAEEYLGQTKEDASGAETDAEQKRHGSWFARRKKSASVSEPLQPNAYRAGAASSAAPMMPTPLSMPQAAVKKVSQSVLAETSNTAAYMSLDEVVSQIDESFSQMLLRKIDEKGMTDAECYKKANIDRKLFSKIRGDVHYKPSKQTAIAFAVALELPLEETKDMLMKAGYALSHSNKFDIIIEFFINRRNYDIFEINEALFAFDQSLLGGKSV
ncbi:MAG: O-acetyl-ADP-ribose deacetylase [bacterium]|nr:O-acetyl-ADP-ribose deacetylase [bacterium]